MNQPLSALCTVLLFLLGTGILRGDEQILPLKYTCELPEGLEKEIVLHHKDNSTERRDAHAIYKRYHASGWHRLMAHYADTGSTMLESVPDQEWGIMTLARDIGGSEARTLILKAELVQGEVKLRAALTRFYKEKKKAERDADARQSATAAESKAQGKKSDP